MNLAQALDRIDELEEELRQLREALVPIDDDDGFGMTQAERRLYQALKSGVRRRRAALLYAVAEGRDVESNNLDVIMHRVRRKLAPHGIVIINIFGQGYELKHDPVHAGLLQAERNTETQPRR